MLERGKPNSRTGPRKVARIYLKAKVLRTRHSSGRSSRNSGCSNAARSFAWLIGLDKNASSIWIVSPINRAVDDKAAKNSAGTSFKLQLTMDGSYSNVTFICSRLTRSLSGRLQISFDVDGRIRSLWDKRRNFAVGAGGLKTRGARPGDQRDQPDDHLEELDSDGCKKRTYSGERWLMRTIDETARRYGSNAEGTLSRSANEFGSENSADRRIRGRGARLGVDGNVTAASKHETSIARGKAIQHDFADGVRETVEDADAQTEIGGQNEPEVERDLHTRSQRVCPSSASAAGDTSPDGTIGQETKPSTDTGVWRTRKSPSFKHTPCDWATSSLQPQTRSSWGKLSQELRSLIDLGVKRAASRGAAAPVLLSAE